MALPPRIPVDTLLHLIDEPYQSACRTILQEHRVLFQTVQGSTHNHQAWPGGYYDHVQEVMNFAPHLYAIASRWFDTLPFSLSDALLILFLHDIEKPWKYEWGPDGHLQEIEALRSKDAQHEFRARKLHEYGIVLTAPQANAMRYVEGELAEYSNKRRVMNELAAFCHCCDTISARIGYNLPQAEDRLRG
ncbi:MAG: hypothetical protein KGI50_03065 [Patescibacteria group bacterium]|nr:hypothetical protein [Patescibacteria group bacterium]MDE2438273.1 hypothetical protein [Patescibacteria group bacterium]